MGKELLLMGGPDYEDVQSLLPHCGGQGCSVSFQNSGEASYLHSSHRRGTVGLLGLYCVRRKNVVRLCSLSFRASAPRSTTWGCVDGMLWSLAFPWMDDLSTPPFPGPGLGQSWWEELRLASLCAQAAASPWTTSSIWHNLALEKYFPILSKELCK